MADASLRQLERRWRESGALADEQLYLQALVRQGKVDTGALEAVALLGDPAARGVRAGPTLLTPEELAKLAGVEPSTLLKWGRDRECPRRPASESPRRVKGKFVYDPRDVLDWRHARIDYCRSRFEHTLGFADLKGNRKLLRPAPARERPRRALPHGLPGQAPAAPSPNRRWRGGSRRRTCPGSRTPGGDRRAGLRMELPGLNQPPR